MLSEPRGLSLPAGRPVVNPFLGGDLEHSCSDSSTDSARMMRLAYYVGASPVLFPTF